MCDIRLPRGAAAFPRRLTSIPDPPCELWVRGDAARLPGPHEASIALVGTRGATRDGLDAAHRIADGLARAGVVVVSGLARGVDAAAHQAVLDAGGRTIAVLGSGLGRIYPGEHTALSDRIAATGAVVSEYPPDTAPHAGLFPRRNRLVAGLADAVVVVEAPEKSGALITAGFALDQGKEVLVVPGRVAGRRNRGGHLLIRDGAMLVESADDILVGLGWDSGVPGPQADSAESTDLVEFTVDDVVQERGEPPQVVLASLLRQEMAGEIRRIGSGRFLRVRPRVLT